ncbi:MAG: phenylalanine--tRNA ligase subunit alpha [Patescibacteria group bacterium]|jgi:phenylalanyl-tRNA synthetase alpha chain
MQTGHLHPTTMFMRKIVNHFVRQGFKVAEGPEAETEWHNFDFLNVSADHPSRDAQDTFWLDKEKLLRTHTTSVQGRIVNPESSIKPPLRYIMPGKIFRNEATDQTHEAIFYQIDGFAIDKDIKLTDLLGELENLFKSILGPDTKIRFRPHLFPFVEPGVEMDLFFKGRWMELLGAGMIHPKVLQNMGLDPAEWQGFAFGLGLDRFLMAYYGIEDIRLFHKNDLRFLQQF